MQARHKINHRRELRICPLRRIAELGEAEAGEGFAFAGKELLHQATLVSLQGLDFPALRGNQLVQRAQAVGDLLLLSKLRQINLKINGIILCETFNSHALVKGKERFLERLEEIRDE